LYLNKPFIPKEHGAWPALLIPILAGSLAVRPEASPNLGAMALLLAAAIFGFMAVSTLRVAITPPPKTARERFIAWTVYYGALAGVPFLWLVLGRGCGGLLWFIIPAGLLTAAYFRSSAAGTKRTLPFEIIGLAGPAAAYVQQGRATLDGALIYLLCLVWFIDRMITARKTLELLRKDIRPGTVMERLKLFSAEYMFHGAGLISVAGVIIASGTHWARILPFAAATLRNGWDTASVAIPTDPMKVGFAEMRLGIIFLVALILAFRI